MGSYYAFFVVSVVEAMIRAMMIFNYLTTPIEDGTVQVWVQIVIDVVFLIGQSAEA